MPEENTIIEAVPFSRVDKLQRRRGISVKPLTVLVVILFTLLALATIFLFASRAVKVTLTPEPETFEFTSGFQYELGGRYLMLPGEYDFSASKTGYQPFDGQLTVGSAPDQDFQFEMVKLPGRLKITTQPPTSSRVYIDQKLAGTTPLEIDSIEAGTHDIKIRSERFLDYDTEIEIEGLRRLQTLSPELTPAWAIISVQSNPSPANIFVDGISINKTPAGIEVIQGERTIEIRKSGYKTWQSSIQVEAGINQTLPDVVLEKSDGKITINSTPAGATVNVNNQYRGQTPLKLVLAPGKNYQIQLSKAGFKKLSRSISLKPDEDVSLNNSLEAILGTVKFQIAPADATLYVDGKPISNAKRSLSLTAKPHRIRISKTGYASYTATITPQAGSAQQHLIQLQTEQEAAIADIPTSITTAANQTLRLILPGELTMGAGRREPGRRSNEVSKQIKLTRSFYLSETEVTNLQYKAFRSGHSPGILERIRLDGDDRPVVNITWQEAASYCNWLSSQAGLPAAYEQSGGIWKVVTPINTGFRLPTEAEWAWSARYSEGPVPDRFPWGNNMPPGSVHANYADESAINMVPYHIIGYNDSFRGPSPVKQYSPNALGIYDLAGNAAEWTNDYYSVDTPRETLVDPAGPNKGSNYVIRGSSYQHGRFSQLRWTYRDFGVGKRADVGFRIARYLE